MDRVGVKSMLLVVLLAMVDQKIVNPIDQGTFCASEILLFLENNLGIQCYSV